MRTRGCLSLLGFVAIALVALGAPAAQAATADNIAPSDPNDPQPDSGWQAGTCISDVPECSVATPDQFFRNSAGHPPVGFTQFIVRNAPPGQSPQVDLKTVRVDLPVGLSVNPQATPQCPLETFESSPASCPAGSAVGTSAVTAADPLLGTPIPPVPDLTSVAVYNIVPPQGEPARFGFNLAGNNVYLQADVDWSGDYHEGFTIDVPAALGGAIGGLILKNRLVFDGRSGDGTFITTPSTCYDPHNPGQPQFKYVYSTWLLASSVAEEESAGYEFPADARPPLESPLPPGEKPVDCEHVPFDPSIEIDPGTSATDSPAGPAVTLDVPHITGGANRDSSNLKDAAVTLPEGMGLNPAAAQGLEACTDEQFGKGTRRPVDCPSASKIGKVEIETPPLPAGSLAGDVYVGEPLSGDPASGDQFRIFLVADSDRFGVSVRLIGNVHADPRTGRLTTTFEDNPQVPFSSLRLDLDDGARAVLSTPGSCGPHETTTALTPWSGNPDATPSDDFQLSDAPDGGSCAGSPGERPFSPSYEAGPRSAQAGAFSPFHLHLGRPDGAQELKRVEVTLPPGMVAKLAGVAYCPERLIAATAGNSGASEQASPTCPSQSLVGSARIAAGAGSDPLEIGGRVYLAGPYEGAPVSLVFVTPALAGPYDLGTVVVRAALRIDPETAQVTAVSDEIPHVFGGVKLDIRSIDVPIDRPKFTLNPTNCAEFSVDATLRGGGGDPLDPDAFESASASSPFQADGCRALGFRPKLFTRLFGGRRMTFRSANPRFRAVYAARPGDANLRRTALLLPSSVILDQGHIRTLCTRDQLAARACPRAAIYGYARAKSPLLAGALKGPVYMVSSDNLLPDLLVDLRGQVNVRLRGVISATKGRLKTVFFPTPDVTVDKFLIGMRGGRRGLLVNSRYLCARRQFSFLNMRAHNGRRRLAKRLRLRVPGCERAKRHRGRRGARRHRSR